MQLYSTENSLCPRFVSSYIVQSYTESHRTPCTAMMLQVIAVGTWIHRGLDSFVFIWVLSMYSELWKFISISHHYHNNNVKKLSNQPTPCGLQVTAKLHTGVTVQFENTWCSIATSRILQYACTSSIQCYLRAAFVLWIGRRDILFPICNIYYDLNNFLHGSCIGQSSTSCKVGSMLTYWWEMRKCTHHQLHPACIV